MRSRSVLPLASAAAFATVFVVGQASAQTSLSAGDIQVLGATSDANDSFSFVLWKDISAGTVIRFMDQSFTNAGNGVLGTENDMSLTFSSGLTAGTVIRVEDTGVTLVNGGTFSGTKTGSLSGISNDGDQVFAYQGTAMGSGTNFSGRTLLYGFNLANTNWLTTSGTANAQTSYLPTTISGTDLNFDSGNFDNVDYTGTRSGMTAAAYRAAISNIDNYTQNDTRFDLGSGGFTSTGSVNLSWDNNGKTAGTGGSGTWDTSTQSRFSNSANTTFLRWVDASAGNGHIAVFGGTAGTVSIASGGVAASGLQFDVNGYTLQNNTITLLDYDGVGTATPTATVTTAGHTATVSSTLAGSSGLTKAGAGTLVLSSNNSYSGGTTISAGTLQIGNGGTTGSLGSGTVTNNAALVFNRSNDFSVSNGIGGTGSLTKKGAGTMTLTGTNSYSGATSVDAGTMKVNGTAINSTFTVNSAATLRGTGSIGDLIVKSGGRVDPGDVAGALGVGDFTMEAGSTLGITALGPLAGTDYTQLNAIGLVSLAGALDITVNFTPIESQLLFILTNDGSEAISGTFTGLDNGDYFDIGAQTYQISYFADFATNSMTGGNDVALQAVPEPVAAGLGGIGLLAILLKRRRQGELSP